MTPDEADIGSGVNALAERVNVRYAEEPVLMNYASGPGAGLDVESRRPSLQPVNKGRYEGSAAARVQRPLLGSKQREHDLVGRISSDLHDSRDIMKLHKKGGGRFHPMSDAPAHAASPDEFGESLRDVLRLAAAPDLPLSDRIAGLERTGYDSISRFLEQDEDLNPIQVQFLGELALAFVSAEQASSDLDAAVARARRYGSTWAAIARVVDQPRSSVHQRWRKTKNAKAED